MGKIKIGAVDYILKEENISNDDKGAHISEIDLMSNTISVQEDLPREQKEIAIIHESIHAINWKLDESTVEFLAQAFYQFIKQNKTFIREIIK